MDDWEQQQVIKGFQSGSPKFIYDINFDVWHKMLKLTEKGLEQTEFCRNKISDVHVEQNDLRLSSSRYTMV